MSDAEIEQHLTDRLMPRKDLRDRGAWTELLVGPGGKSVFAVHRINDSKPEGDRMLIMDHAFRYVPSYSPGPDNSWELDFPDECPHWLHEFERWRLQGIQGVSPETEPGVFDHYTLFEFATSYPIHEEYAPRVVQLFDALVRLPVEFARLLGMDPNMQVSVGVLPPSIRLFVERAFEVDLPLSRNERLAFMLPLREWRQEETSEELRWLAHALMSELFVTGPYLVSTDGATDL